MSSSSTSRRSTVNTSRGHPVNSSITTNGLSSSSDRVAIENDEEVEEEEGGDSIPNGNAAGMVEDVRTLLEEFDRTKYPLSRNIADTHLKLAVENWQSEHQNLDDMIAILGDCAERRADTIADDKGDENDETLKKFEFLCRTFLDLKQESEIRKEALQSIRTSVLDGKEVDDAAELYKKRVNQSLTDYTSKTKRQKYGQSKAYEKHRTRVWQALTEEPMPPLIDLINPEVNEVVEDTDDIAVYGASSIQQYKCPLTLRVMVNPIRSTVCPHAYEKDAILEFLGSATKPCPATCSSKINKRNLVEDSNFTKECKTFARRQDRRQQRERTQVESTTLD